MLWFFERVWLTIHYPFVFHSVLNALLSSHNQFHFILQKILKNFNSLLIKTKSIKPNSICYSQSCKTPPFNPHQFVETKQHTIHDCNQSFIIKILDAILSSSISFVSLGSFVFVKICVCGWLSVRMWIRVAYMQFVVQMVHEEFCKWNL